MAASGFELKSFPTGPLFQSLYQPSISCLQIRWFASCWWEKLKMGFCCQETLRFSWQHEPADIIANSPSNVRENIPLGDIFSTGNLPRNYRVCFWIWESEWEKTALVWKVRGSGKLSRISRNPIPSNPVVCVHPGRAGSRVRRADRGPEHNFFSFFLTVEQPRHRHLEEE